MDESSSLIQAILELTGWTQARLVQELRQIARSLGEPAPAGLTVVTVNRWKQGKQSPSVFYRRLIRELYTRTYQARVRDSAVGPGTYVDEVATMKRRQFLAYTALLTGTAVVEPGRLAALASTGLRGIDGRLLDSLSEVVNGYARLWHVVSPDVLSAAVRNQLGALNELRAACRPPLMAARLTSLAAHTAALAGWLSWLSGNRHAAGSYYAFSDGLATEVRDDSARAFVLVLRSFTCSDLFRSDKKGSGEALTLLHEACDLAGRGTSPFLRVFALGRRAEEHAVSGASDAAVAAGHDLDRAERALSAVSGPDEGFFAYWNQDRLIGCRGTCAMLLDQPDEAVRLLSRVLTTTPQELAAERSILLTDLGAAYAQQAEVEQACDALSRSLAMGGAGDANRIKRILSVRQTSLHRWADVARVRTLDEELQGAHRPGTPGSGSSS